MTTTYQDLLQEILPRPIASETAYKRALGKVERLLRKSRKSQAEGDMIALMSMLIEQYEMRLGYTTPLLSPRDRLSGLLDARGLTQTELSQQSGVPRTTINEILADKRSISKANATRLARFFGVPLEEFIG